MCGIIGIIGKDPVAGPLLDALKRLEYRGYDSAGIATLVNGGIERRRAKGKLENLLSRIQSEPIAGTTRIGGNCPQSLRQRSPGSLISGPSKLPWPAARHWP